MTKLLESVYKKYHDNSTLNSVMFELTYRCNCRCIHCYLDNNDKHELATGEVLEIVHQLQTVSYDLLIDITTRHFLAVDYLIIYANAKCRTGIKKTGVNIYDFALDLPDSFAEENMEHQEDDYLYNYNQLIFYLKNIQTKDY